jgi:hypothetical protein
MFITLLVLLSAIGIRDKMQSIPLYVVKQVCGYTWVLWYLPLIKLTTRITAILRKVEQSTSHSVFISSLRYNHIGGVMVSVLASGAIHREFEPRSAQTKDYEIGICCFSAK